MLQDRHDLPTAMELSGFTEEEAYFILRLASFRGYSDAIKRLKGFRAYRQWFVWIGGWEPPTITQRDRGAPAWRFSRDPFPVSLLGHRITFYWWFRFSLKCFGGYLCASDDYANTLPTRLFWSPNGTPARARWLIGRRPA